MQPRGIRLPTKVWKVQALKCDGGPFLPRDISCCFSEYARSSHPWVFLCCAVLLPASHWVLFQLPKEATTLSFQSSLMAPQCNSVDGHEYFRTYSLPAISLVMVIVLNWHSMLKYWPEGTLQFCKVCNFHKNRIARSYRLILHTVGPSLSALVNTKFDSPIPTAWNVASVFEIFEQKRFASCCGQLWQSVPKTEPPLAPTALLYAEQDLSPLGIIIMRLGRGTQISKLSKLHWLDWLRSNMTGEF